jgi:hypothetical protein
MGELLEVQDEYEAIKLTNDTAQVIELMGRTRVLLDRAKAMKAPELPLFVRVLNTRRAALLLQEAEDLLEQVGILMNDPVPTSNRPWYARRRSLLCLQWITGTANAYSMVCALIEGFWIIAALSALCLAVTTQWIIPRK